MDTETNTGEEGQAITDDKSPDSIQETNIDASNTEIVRVTADTTQQNHYANFPLNEASYQESHELTDFSCKESSANEWSSIISSTGPEISRPEPAGSSNMGFDDDTTDVKEVYKKPDQVAEKKPAAPNEYVSPPSRQSILDTHSAPNDHRKEKGEINSRTLPDIPGSGISPPINQSGTQTEIQVGADYEELNQLWTQTEISIAEDRDGADHPYVAINKMKRKVSKRKLHILIIVCTLVILATIVSFELEARIHRDTDNPPLFRVPQIPTPTTVVPSTDITTDIDRLTGTDSSTVAIIQSPTTEARLTDTYSVTSSSVIATSNIPSSTEAYGHICTFEGSDLCGYESNNNGGIQWIKMSASRKIPDHTYGKGQIQGHYIQLGPSTEMNAKITAQLESPQQTSLADGYLEFWYYMYSSSRLRVDIYQENGELIKRVRSKSWKKGGNWHCIKIPVHNARSGWKVVITGTNRRKFDSISIDDISINHGTRFSSSVCQI